MSNNKSFTFTRKFIVKNSGVLHGEEAHDPHQKYIWQLDLMVSKRNISTRLQFRGHNTDTVKHLTFAKFSFTVMDCNQKQLCHIGSEFGKYFVTRGYSEEGASATWGFKDILDLQNVLPAQTAPISLKILCTIEYLDDPNTICDFLSLPLEKASDPSGYSALLDSGFCSDFSLQLNGTSFAVHKAILGAQSQTFSKIFEQQPELEMLEITDTSMDCLISLLIFIYTNGFHGSSLDTPRRNKPRVQDLLNCAEKYQLNGLILNCCLNLQKGIDVTTAAERLMIASRYQNRELLQKTVDYINKNHLPVKGTEGWKLHIASNVDLLDCLFKRHAMPRRVSDLCLLTDSASLFSFSSPPGTGQRLGQSFSFEHTFNLKKEQNKQGEKDYVSRRFADPKTGQVWCLVVRLQFIEAMNRTRALTYPDVSLYLQLCASPKETGSVHVDFSFLVTELPDGKELWHLKSLPPQEFKFSNLNVIHGYPRFMNMGKESMTIKVSCTIEDSHPPEKSQDILFDNFNSILQTGLYSDVILCVGGEELKAHKAILAARSPVFHAMFEHKMQESLGNKVEISDTSLACAKALLSYIYGNVKPEQADVPTSDLLVIAEKYQVKYLKHLCEVKLRKDTTISNACELWVLADMYRASSLKGHVMEFITKNFSVVARTEGWSQHMKNNPLFLDQFHAFSVHPVTEF